MKMEQTEPSETLAFKLQTPENNPEENIRRRSRILATRLMLLFDNNIKPYNISVSIVTILWVVNIKKIHNSQNGSWDTFLGEKSTAASN
jgi:hypothetical protein